MKMTTIDPRHLIEAEIRDLRAITAGLSDTDLAKSTSCTGWRVADLITHLRLGMDEILQGLSSATDKPTDRDAISYWRDWPPTGPASFSDVRWIWAQSASYATASGLRDHFEVSAAAAQAACAQSSSGPISFQSHVMMIDDFLSMWIVEFAVHHFDLVRDIENQRAPSEEVIDLLIATLQTLTGVNDLNGWDELTFIRKATGRETLNRDDLEKLGDKKRRFPAFG
jgi:uncharacterized protein (TIGR03083 family)